MFQTFGARALGMETAFLAFQRHAWVWSLVLALAYGIASGGPLISAETSLNSFHGESAFMRSSTGECDALWGSWPKVQERAIADGTVMIWNMTTSVGNLMRTLMYILPLVRLLEIGLIINVEHFPAFRVAFEPESIKWDHDPQPFIQRAKEIAKGLDSEGLHALRFYDGILILSDSQLELLAMRLGIRASNHARIKSAFRKQHRNRWRSYLATADLDPAPPCAWNMLLRRSTSMMVSMKSHSPWESIDQASATHHYIAWHIRTSEGETEFSFNPAQQKYIFHGQASLHVCPLFLSTMEVARKAVRKAANRSGSALSHGTVEGLPVYISSNSKSMAHNCSVEAELQQVETGFVDLGIGPSSAHTAFSKNPDTFVNAFVDFLYLMDATVLIRTSSSFSGSVTDIKGYHCSAVNDGDLPVRKIYICQPAKN